MKLFEDDFMMAFESFPEVTEGAVLMSVLDKMGFEGERRKEAEEAFPMLVKIMRAKEAVELEDMSVEDILLCFQYVNVFEEYFMGKKAGDYFSDIEKNMAVLKTARKRRIL